MPHIIMRRGLLDLSTRTPLSIARLSASAPSSHDLSLAAFTISMAESSFRHTHHPIAPRSPWQNAYVERLIGSIPRECLDHMIVFGEAHLRRILSGYAAYYNASRTLSTRTPLS